MGSGQSPAAGAGDAESPDTATLGSFSRTGGADETGERGGPVFLPAEVLADRFRVVRLLGRGGMGEVYEVEDLELGERVAVKTLTSQLAASDRALALFRSEIQLARRVTHPNVSRVFDVFRHRRQEGGDSRSVVFLTMELLAGETLSARLRRDGPLAPEAALPLIRQIAAALDAAHAAGVVHRDFKSGNVLLVEGADGPRAVITDFGLAGAAEGAGEETSASPYGTPPYRAPEQEAGGRVGPAADLYAFGVVIREMLTGRPGVATDELPREIAATVERCLARRPRDRPASAAEVVRGLAGRPGQPPRPWWRRRGPLSALAASLAALLIAVLVATFPARRGAGVPGAPLPPALMVLSTTPETEPGAGGAWQAFALAELLAAEVPRGLEVSTPLEVFGLRGAGAGRPETLRALGFDAALRVTRRDAGGGPVCDLELVRPAEGARQPLDRFSQPCDAGRLDAIAARLATPLRALAQPPGDPLPPARRRALLGSDPAALETFARGRAALAGSDPRGALAALRRAVEQQPDAFRFRLALAGALFELGSGDEAGEEARRAVALAAALGPEERLRARVLEARIGHDRPRAAAALEELVHDHPGSRDDVFALLTLLHESGELPAARQVVDELRRRQPEVESDPRLHLYLAAQHRFGNDPAAALASARRARRRAGELALPLLAFGARFNEFNALQRSERFGEAAAVARQAESLARHMGDDRRLGHSLRWLGVAHLEMGNDERAEAAFRRSLDLARRNDDGGSAAWCLNNLGVISTSRGDLERAAELYGEAMRFHRRQGNQIELLMVQGNLAEVRMAQGRLQEALQMSQEVLIAAQNLRAGRTAAASLHRLGQLALEMGDTAAADNHLQRAEAASRESAESMLPLVWSDRAVLHLHRGEVAAARELAQRAVETAAGRSILTHAVALEASGRVEEAAHRPAEALALQRRALERARASAMEAQAARIRRRIGGLLRKLGRAEEARDLLTTTLGDQLRYGSLLEAAHTRMELARLAVAGGNRDDAAELARLALDAYARAGDRDDAARAAALLRRLRHGEGGALAAVLPGDPAP